MNKKQLMSELAKFVRTQKWNATGYYSSWLTFGSTATFTSWQE